MDNLPTQDEIDNLTSKLNFALKTKLATTLAITKALEDDKKASIELSEAKDLLREIKFDLNI